MVQLLYEEASQLQLMAPGWTEPPEPVAGLTEEMADPGSSA